MGAVAYMVQSARRVLSDLKPEPKPKLQVIPCNLMLANPRGG